MYKVLIQVLDEAGAEVFSADIPAERDSLILPGYATPGLKTVASVLLEVVEK